MRDLNLFVEAAIDRGKIYCNILERSKQTNDLIQQRKNRMLSKYSNAVARVGDDGYGYGSGNAVARLGYDSNADPVMADLYKTLDMLQKEWKSVE